MSKDVEPVEPYYQRRAKDFVDMMYDNKMLSPDFSRDDLQAVEDYVGFLLESAAKSAAKTAVMLHSLKGNKS